MDEAACVCVREAGGELGCDAQRLVVGKRAGLQPLLERAVRQVLEHHERLAVCLAVVVDGADVGVRQRGGGAGLALEARAVGARSERLDGDAATQLLVLGEPDGAHRASPERLVQAVAPRDQIPGHAGDYREVGVDDLPGIDEALDQVLSRVQPIAAEAVPVAAAAGRVLAQDARAVVDLPPFASSAMDGYAVRASDTPGRLPVGRPVGRRLAARTPAGRGRGDRHLDRRSGAGGCGRRRAGRGHRARGRRRPGRRGERGRARSPAWRRCAQRRDDRLRGPAARADAGGCPRRGRARVRRLRAQAAGRRARDRHPSCALPARRWGPARSTSRTPP